MTALILWLLFLRDVVGPGGTVHWPPILPQASTPLSRLVFAALAVAAVAMVWLFYRREAAWVPLGRKRLLAGLRAGAFLVIIFICTGAYLEVTRSEDAKGSLVLLVDQSSSMALVDKRTDPADQAVAAAITGEDAAKSAAMTRHELLRRAIANPRLDPLPELAARFRVDLATFGAAGGVAQAELAPVDDPAGAFAKLPAADEPATQLGAALVDAVRRNRGRKLDGLVMFTDGGWNRGEDPVEAARALGVPVHVVGVGLPQAKDLEITFVSCDDVVFKGDSFPLTVRIRARGYANRNLRLKILRDDQSIRDEVVALGAEGEVQHQVILPADRAGVFAFGAEVETLSDEASAENNRRSKAGVRVIDRRITVLLCEDSPRWEFRALREGLAADKARIQVKTWMRQADPGGLEGQVAIFPRNADELRGYDVVVLGAVDAEAFTKADLTLLETWVREQGGGLVLLAGHNGMPDKYQGTPLEDLLPVHFVPQPPTTAMDEAARTLRTPFRVALTPEGKAWAPLRLTADAAANDALWAKAEPLFWVYPATGLKPGASALMVHSERKAGDGPLPVMAAQRFGKGQVLWIGSDELWRWRKQPGAAYHRRLWGQIVTSYGLAHLLGANSRVQLETDRPEYAVGDKAQITARIVDAAFNPATAPSVTCVLRRDLGQETVVLTAKPDQPGTYTGTWTAAAVGSWALGLQDQRDAEGPVVSVVAPRIELEDPGLRESLLREVAKASGGSFTYLHELPSLVQRLTVTERQTALRREELTLWNAPGVMILLALLLGLEWFLRKRSDLL